MPAQQDMRELTASEATAVVSDAAQRKLATLAPVPAPVSDGGLVGMLERLALSPDVDVAKLEKLIAMQERILDRDAKAAFDSAFARMQVEIPNISERGRGDRGEKGGSYTYARFEDVIKAVRPILHKHGFALSHRTSFPNEKRVLITGVLSHEQGHSRESTFLAEADSGGGKNGVQAMGSSSSYGRRYTTYDLLGIATTTDDDGAKAEQFKAPADPAGFEAFIDGLRDSAVAGTFSDAFNKAPLPLRTHLTRHHTEEFQRLKQVSADALKVGRK